MKSPDRTKLQVPKLRRRDTPPALRKPAVCSLPSRVRLGHTLKKPPEVAWRLGVDLAEILRPLSPTPADAQQAEGREGEGRRLRDGCYERGG